MVTLTKGRIRTDAVLFGESQSRVVISVKASHRQTVLDHARSFGVPADVIGTVSGDRLVISVRHEGTEERLIDQPVSGLLDRWACALERSLSHV